MCLIVFYFHNGVASSALDSKSAYKANAITFHFNNVIVMVIIRECVKFLQFPQELSIILCCQKFLNYIYVFVCVWMCVYSEESILFLYHKFPGLNLLVTFGGEWFYLLSHLVGLKMSLFIMMSSLLIFFFSY